MLTNQIAQYFLNNLFRNTDQIKLKYKDTLDSFRREVDIDEYEIRFLHKERPNFKFAIIIKAGTRCSAHLKVNTCGNKNERIEKWIWVKKLLPEIFGFNPIKY